MARYAGGLALALALTACGAGQGGSQAQPATAATPGTSAPTASPSSTPASATPTTASATIATPAGRTLEVTITGKQVDPPPATIDLPVGETLTVTITSDHDDELHAHGFEVEGELRAGVPTTVVLRGAEPGVYEVESHHPALRLFQVAVR